MTTPELIEFVKKEISLGVGRDIINSKLKVQGWSDLDIIEAFSIINQTSVPPIPAHEEILTEGSNLSNSINQVNPINNFNSTPYTQTRSKNKLAKLLLVILIPIILISGAAIAYGFGYFTDSGKLFSDLSDFSEKNTSFSYDVNFNLDASDIKLPEESNSFDSEKFKVVNFVARGASDFSDKENIKMKNSLLFKAGDIEAGFDLRMINKSMYFSLTKAPDLGFFSLKPFENKWVVFPLSDDSELLKNSPLSSLSPINSDIVSDLTDEQKQQISEIVKNTKFIKITKKHLPVMIDGSLSYHFDFDLDKEGIVSFLKNTTEYMKNSDKYKSELSTIKDSDYDKIFDYIKTFHGEAWIGIFDKLPHKILVNMELINPDKKDDGVAKLNLSAIYSDWNKPVKVEIPADAVTLEKLMSGMFGGELGTDENTLMSNSLEDSKEINSINSFNPLDNSKNKAIEAEIKSILSSIRAQAELFYDTNKNNTGYKGFCSSKGEFGAYSMAIKLPQNTIYKCNDSNTEWASWVKLPNNEYWCVDNTGHSQSLKIVPKGTSCAK